MARAKRRPFQTVNLKRRTTMPNIVIVGSGPAGVSAALYAVRAGVDTTVLT